MERVDDGPDLDYARPPLTPEMRAYLRREAAWRPALLFALAVAALAVVVVPRADWPPGSFWAFLGWAAIGCAVFCLAVCAWRALLARADLHAGTYVRECGPVCLEEEEDREMAGNLLCNVIRFLGYSLADRDRWLRTPARRFDVPERVFDDLRAGLGAEFDRFPVAGWQLPEVPPSGPHRWVYGAWARVTYLPKLGELVEVRDVQGRQVYVHPECARRDPPPSGSDPLSAPAGRPARSSACPATLGVEPMLPSTPESSSAAAAAHSRARVGPA